MTNIAPSRARAEPSRRIPLPSRRRLETRQLEWPPASGNAVQVSVGYDDVSDAPKELFYAGGYKEGSDLQATITDACIAISVMLQHEGFGPEALARSMSSVIDPVSGSSVPASIIGVLVRELLQPPSWAEAIDESQAVVPS